MHVQETAQFDYISCTIMFSNKIHFEYGGEHVSYEKFGKMCVK